MLDQDSAVVYFSGTLKPNSNKIHPSHDGSSSQTPNDLGTERITETSSPTSPPAAPRPASRVKGGEIQSIKDSAKQFRSRLFESVGYLCPGCSGSQIGAILAGLLATGALTILFLRYGGYWCESHGEKDCPY